MKYLTLTLPYSKQSMLTIDGVISDGNSSKLSPAELQVGVDNTLLLRTQNSTFNLPIDSIEPSSRIGNSARYISIEGHGRFETRDNEGVDSLLGMLGKNTEQGFPHKLESNLWLIVMASIVTIAFIWAFSVYGVPKAADTIVDALPKKTSDFIERKLLEHLESEMFQPSELPEQRQQEILSIYNGVLKKLELDDVQTQLKIRKGNDDIGANALAFPSGTIVITDQLTKVVTSDKQLSGIIAHEIGHIAEQHSLRQMVRGSIFSLAIAFILGDVSGASTAILSAPALLMELQYSREFESDADGYALRYFECDIEGLDQMAAFFGSFDTRNTENLESLPVKTEAHEQKPEQSKSTPGTQSNSGTGSEKTPKNKNHSNLSRFLSTHPLSENRKQFFENHINRHCL